MYNHLKMLSRNYLFEAKKFDFLKRYDFFQCENESYCIYNFIKTHTSLSKNYGNSTIPRTPALYADHNWTINSAFNVPIILDLISKFIQYKL
jgi:hypothetical protein